MTCYGSQDNLFGAKRTRTVFEGPKSKEKSAKKKLKNGVDATVAKPIADPEEAARSNLGLGMLQNTANSKVAKIDNVSYAKFTTGVIAYGYVLQLNDSSAVISLPGGLTGTVALSEISDVCQNLVGPTKKEVIAISLSVLYVTLIGTLCRACYPPYQIC